MLVDRIRGLPTPKSRPPTSNKGAGRIPALGLIPKLASHICYELGSTDIQACRCLLELIQLLTICSFGNPNAQPPTPTQTPTSGQFPSPTAFQTPRNSSNFESRGGWTPTFAEEYSVSNFLRPYMSFRCIHCLERSLAKYPNEAMALCL